MASVKEQRESNKPISKYMSSELRAFNQSQILQTIENTKVWKSCAEGSKMNNSK